VGSTISYSIGVRNLGNVTLTGVRVGDANATNISNTIIGVLGAGQFASTITATHVVTQADIDAGVVVNTATVTGTPPSGPDVTNQSTVSTTLTQTPTISVVKTVSVVSGTTVDGTIIYNLAVTNTGNVTLTNVTVGDANATISSGNPIATLTPSVTVNLSATHTITQADFDAGVVINTATVTGTPPSGPPVTSSPSTVSTTLTSSQFPRITITKTVLSNAPYTVGSTISYSIGVRNLGNVTLTGVRVGDANATNISNTIIGVLGAGQFASTITATHVVTQADIDAGVVVNTATVTGTPPSGPDVTNQSTVSTTLTQTPTISIVKTVTGTLNTTVGSIITYNLAVTNTGNVTLTNVTVGDANAAIASGNPIATLTPSITVNLTATHQITPADINAGMVVNTATVTGTPPIGPPVTSTPSTVTTTLSQTPALTIVKTENSSGPYTLGSVIGYNLLVTNTGNVTLTNVTVSDPNATAIGRTSVGTLLVNGSTNITATHTVTQSDVDAGVVVNTASATGKDPGGNNVPAAPSTVTTTLFQSPAITIVKTVIGSGPYALNGTINYNLAVTNTGSVTLSNVQIGDANASSLNSNFISLLSVNQTINISATHIVSQSDLDAGLVVNTATVTGKDPQGHNVSGTPSTVTTTLTQTSSLTVVKTEVSSQPYAQGSVIAYNIAVTNTGTVDLSNVVITDANADAGSVAPSVIALLPPNVTITVSATHTVSASDILATQVVNTASATGTDPGGHNVPATSNTVITPLQRVVDLGVTKTSDKPAVAAGTPLVYTITVVNYGPNTLSRNEKVKIADILPPGIAVASVSYKITRGGSAYDPATGNFTLDSNMNVGDTISLQITGLVAGNYIKDTVINNVSVSTPPSVTDPNPSNNHASVFVTPIYRFADLAVVKTADKATISSGSTLTYTITITNNGPSSLVRGEVITVNDNLPAGLLNINYTASNGTYNSGSYTLGSDLAAGNSVTLKVQGIITPDYTAASILNTVNVAPPIGVSDTIPTNDTSSIIVPVTRQIDLSITKTADRPSVSAGGTIAYTIVVTNNGPTTLVTGETIRIFDTLPAQLVPATVQATIVKGGSAYDMTTGLFTLNDYLKTGGTVVLRLTGTVGSVTAIGTVIRNAVSVSPPAGVSDTNPNNNQASVLVSVTPYATAVDLVANGASICPNTTALLTALSTSVIHPIYTWYADAALTNVLQVGPTFTTPGLAVTTTYYVTVKGDNKIENLPGTAKAVTVTVNGYAGLLDIVTDTAVSICNGTIDSAKAALAAGSAVVNPVFTWYTDSTLLNSVGTGAMYVTPPITGTKTYYVTVKGNNMCENLSGTAQKLTITTRDCSAPKLGLSKAATSIISLGGNTNIFTYLFKIANSGKDTIAGLTLKDDLTKTFPGYISIGSINLISLTPGLKVNNSFNGVTETNLLPYLPTPTTTLNPGDVDSLQLQVTVQMPITDTTTIFYNIATAGGISTANGQSVSKQSRNGTDPVDPLDTTTTPITGPIGTPGNPGNPTPPAPTPVVVPHPIIIPGGFSPNGDGINDSYVISGVPTGKTVHIEIYNRYNNLVYKNVNYKNDWKGTDNQGLHFGEDLPDGTYFYLIIIDNVPYKGFLTLNR